MQILVLIRERECFNFNIRAAGVDAGYAAGVSHGAISFPFSVVRHVLWREIRPLFGFDGIYLREHLRRLRRHPLGAKHQP